SGAGSSRARCERTDPAARVPSAGSLLGWSSVADHLNRPSSRLHASGARSEHRTAHVFVTGGVASSLGKGLTASSLGRLLRSRGLRVTMQKLEAGCREALAE